MSTLGTKTGTAVACVALISASVAAGCATGSDAGHVTVTSDLSDSVELRLCSNRDCSKFHPPRFDLEPGSAVGINISKHGVPSVYLVLSPTESRLGCLPFVMPEPAPDVEARVSQHVPCGRAIDTETPWP